VRTVFTLGEADMVRTRTSEAALVCLSSMALVVGVVGQAAGQTIDPLTPDMAALQRLRDSVGPGPVVLVNLVKFRSDGGREAYGRYVGVVGPLLQRAGGQIVYSGTAGPMVAGREEDWDQVILVRYDNIDRFIEMVGDPIYQTEARRHRTEALERTLWMVSVPPN